MQGKEVIQAMNDGWNIILQAMLIVSLVSFSFLDLRSQQLPRWIMFVVWVAILFIKIVFEKATVQYIVGGMAIGGGLLLISRVTREAIGYGDGILVLIIGTVSGILKTLLVLFYGLLLGCMFCSILLCFHKIKKKDTIPFAPFLLVAYLGVLVGW